MTNEEIFSRVHDILTDQLGVESDAIKITSDIKDDLGADSLDTVDIITSIEEGFDVEVPDEVAETIKTVEDIVKYIEEKKA